MTLGTPVPPPPYPYPLPLPTYDRNLHHQSPQIGFQSTSNACKSHQIHDILVVNENLLRGQKEDYLGQKILRDTLDKNRYENTVLRGDLVGERDTVNLLRADLRKVKAEAWGERG